MADTGDQRLQQLIEAAVPGDGHGLENNLMKLVEVAVPSEGGDAMLSTPPPEKVEASTGKKRGRCATPCTAGVATQRQSAGAGARAADAAPQPMAVIRATAPMQPAAAAPATHAVDSLEHVAEAAVKKATEAIKAADAKVKALEGERAAAGEAAERRKQRIAEVERELEKVRQEVQAEAAAAAKVDERLRAARDKRDKAQKRLRAANDVVRAAANLREAVAACEAMQGGASGDSGRGSKRDREEREAEATEDEAGPSQPPAEKKTRP